MVTPADTPPLDRLISISALPLAVLGTWLYCALYDRIVRRPPRPRRKEVVPAHRAPRA